MLTLAGEDMLTSCPSCAGKSFVRASLFSAGGLARGRLTGAAPDRGASGVGDDSGLPGPGGRILASRGGGHTTRLAEMETLGHGGVLSRPEPIDGDAWLQDAREQIDEPGEHLAYEESGELKTVALTREWTRIGRSLAADLRFDDPTVSRRHALVVRQADGVRVLDDRSLNGVFVNGQRIDGSGGVAQRALHDGDEIVVGRYRLRFLSIPAATPGERAAAPALHHAD
jgi:hypothetical protein